MLNDGFLYGFCKLLPTETLWKELFAIATARLKKFTSICGLRFPLHFQSFTQKRKFKLPLLRVQVTA